jgi:hypothetical protein
VSLVDFLLSFSLFQVQPKISKIDNGVTETLPIQLKGQEKTPQDLQPVVDAKKNVTWPIKAVRPNQTLNSTFEEPASDVVKIFNLQSLDFEVIIFIDK